MSDTTKSNPGKGVHPNSLANLKPVQPGEIRNREGKNQFSYREDTEKQFADRAKKRMGKVLDRLFDAAEDEKGAAELRMILERAFPAVAKVDVELPGADIAGLVDGLAALAARRRASRDDREPDETPEDGSE